jgi:hypothetical protein
MAARMYCGASALPVFLLPLIVTGWVTGTQGPLYQGLNFGSGSRDVIVTRMSGVIKS